MMVLVRSEYGSGNSVAIPTRCVRMTPADVLARIRATTTPAPAPKIEPVVLPVLALDLPSRLPRNLDMVRADASQLLSYTIDQCESDESYEAHVEVAWRNEVRRRESVGVRVLAALTTSEWIPDEEVWGLSCPACDPNSTRAGFRCLVTLDEVRGLCADGCSSAAIAGAITTWVTAHEHRERLAAQNEAASAMAAELSFRNLRKAPSQRWIIPGFIAADGLTLLSGTSGDGKTFLTMYTSVCTALGLPWFDRPVQPVRTLLFLLDGAAPDNRRRFDLLAAGLGVDQDKFDDTLDIHPDGRPFLADDPESMAGLLTRINTLGHRLIIIDNLTNARGQTDENSAAHLSAALKPLAELAHKQGVGILLIHHANARGELRGSSAIRQYADMVFEIKRSNATNTSPVRLTRTKDRYGLSFEELRYRFADRTTPDGEITAIVPAALPAYRPDPDDMAPDDVDPEEEKEPKGPVEIPWSSKFDDLLACLPATSADVYRAVRASRTLTLKIRYQLERQGKIVLKGKEWHKV